MARQVLKVPDLPPEVLIQSEGDSRYLQQGQADARYVQIANAFTKAQADALYEPIDSAYTKSETDARYLQLTGGAVSGALTVQGKAVAASPDGGNALEFRSNGFYAGGGGGGSFSSIRDEEFAPAAAATTVTLAATPTNLMVVSRNGVIQSQAAGNYSLAGSTITFTDAFVAGERVSVVYEIGVAAGDLAYTKNDSDTRFVNVAGDTMTGNLQVNANVGVGVAPAAWGGDFLALQVRPGMSLAGNNGTGAGQILQNAYWDGTNYRALFNAAASLVRMVNGTLAVDTAPSVAAGVAQVFTNRFHISEAGYAGFRGEGNQGLVRIDAINNADTSYMQLIFGRGGPGSEVNRWRIGENIAGGNAGTFHIYDDARGTASLSISKTTGTVTLTPAAGQNALVTNSGPIVPASDLLGTATLGSAANRFPGAYLTYINAGPSANMFFRAGAGYYCADPDNGLNMGHPSFRWAAIYCVNPTIQTSHVSMKRDFARLDPSSCVGAVLETDWLSFSYIPPTRSEDASDEDYAKLVSETAAGRQQKGYVLGSEEYRTADLFGQSDRYSASTAADLAVVACALQAALQRLAALERHVGVTP